MSNFNYCYDKCEFNNVPKSFWTEVVDKKPVQHSTAVKGKLIGPKFKLDCVLGYKQTVNSYDALKNSLAQGAQICPRLKKLFGKES
jgi:hypothetical protein